MIIKLLDFRMHSCFLVLLRVYFLLHNAISYCLTMFEKKHFKFRKYYFSISTASFNNSLANLKRNIYFSYGTL